MTFEEASRPRGETAALEQDSTSGTCQHKCIDEVLGTVARSRSVDTSRQISDSAISIETIIKNAPTVDEAVNKSDLGSLLVEAQNNGNLAEVVKKVNADFGNDKNGWTNSLTTYPSDGDIMAIVARSADIDHIDTPVSDFSYGKPLSTKELENAAARMADNIFKHESFSRDSDTYLTLGRINQNKQMDQLVGELEGQLGDADLGLHYWVTSAAHGADKQGHPISELTLHKSYDAEGDWTVKK